MKNIGVAVVAATTIASFSGCERSADHHGLTPLLKQEMSSEASTLCGKAAAYSLKCGQATGLQHSFLYTGTKVQPVSASARSERLQDLVMSNGWQFQQSTPEWTYYCKKYWRLMASTQLQAMSFSIDNAPDNGCPQK